MMIQIDGKDIKPVTDEMELTIDILRDADIIAALKGRDVVDISVRNGAYLLTTIPPVSHLPHSQRT